MGRVEVRSSYTEMLSTVSASNRDDLLNTAGATSIASLLKPPPSNSRHHRLHTLLRSSIKALGNMDPLIFAPAVHAEHRDFTVK